MKNLFGAVLLIFLLVNTAGAYTVHIFAPAVLGNIDKGALTSIYLNVTPGTGYVNITTGSSATVAEDTVQSARIAVAVAGSYLAANTSKYNFNYVIRSNSSNVSGPSAGLALTLLAIAGMKNVQLNSNFTVTGTISPNGTVGQIGGVFDKVQAANSINAKYILVPYLTTSNYQYLLYYLSQQAYAVPVIEVKNVSQAVPYAFYSPKVTPLTYSVLKNYQTGALPFANSSCSMCNDSAFAQLANFTYNFTQQQINNINGNNFASIKAQMQQQLTQYEQIGSKGYLYSAADLAFNEYPVAFMFSNYNNATYTNALQILNNISSYCQSVNSTGPQLTNTNYEYVFGGEARMAWAQITLSAAYQELNVSQTSDGVLLILQSAAPAYSWCLATGQMYSIASSLGGNPVTLSAGVQTKALNSIQNVQQYGNLLYVNASKQAYAQREYGAALYSAEYARIFYNASNLAYANANSVLAAVNKSLQSPNGIWPQQFAYQAKFYFYQSTVSNSTATPIYLDQAYTVALLSQGLGSVNSYLQNNFVAGAASSSIGASAAQYQQLENNTQLIFAALIVIIILLVLILFVLLVYLARLENRDTDAKAAAKAAMQQPQQIKKGSR